MRMLSKIQLTEPLASKDSVASKRGPNDPKQTLQQGRGIEAQSAHMREKTGKQTDISSSTSTTSTDGFQPCMNLGCSVQWARFMMLDLRYPQKSTTCKPPNIAAELLIPPSKSSYQLASAHDPAISMILCRKDSWYAIFHQHKPQRRESFVDLYITLYNYIYIHVYRIHLYNIQYT